MEYNDFKNNVYSFFGYRDQAVRQPIEAEQPQPARRDGRIASPEGGWHPAGVTIDGNLVILSLVSGRYVTLGAQDLNERKLMLLLGPRFCDRYTVVDPKTKKRKFQTEELVREIAAACQDFGLFDWSRVRGPGLYQNGEGLVINDGARVMTTAGERVIPEPDYTGACYQAGPSLGFSMHTPCASMDDVQSLLKALRSFGFRTEADFVSTLGWLAAVSFGSALREQWILAVTADRGSGKTSLAELALALLGTQAFRRDGIPTKAQVLAELEERPMTVIVDEAESTADKKLVADLFEVVRSGTQASQTKNHARVYGGRLRRFNAPAGAMLAGISLPSMNSATEGRTVRVNLDRLPDSSRRQYQALLDPARQDETVELGARMRRLLISRWPAMRDTLRLARDVLLGIGHENRDASKWATVLAGYVTLSQDTAATAQQVEHLVKVLNLRQPETVMVDRDGETCLTWLLRRRVTALVVHGNERRKQQVSIYDLLREVLHGPQEERQPLIRQLEEFGLRPLWRTTADEVAPTWKLAICGSIDHPGVRSLMQHSNWARGGWKDVLARLPGAEAVVQRIAGRVERVVVLPMPEELLEQPVTEAYELPDDTHSDPAVPDDSQQ